MLSDFPVIFSSLDLLLNEPFLVLIMYGKIPDLSLEIQRGPPTHPFSHASPRDVYLSIVICLQHFIRCNVTTFLNKRIVTALVKGDIFSQHTIL